MIREPPMAGGTAWQTSDRAHRRQWLGERWLALTGLVLIVPFVVLGGLGSLAWLGRPFPGFFVMENGVVPTVGLSSWSGLAAGIPFHARVVAIDGRPIADPAEIYEHAAEVPVGTVVEYTVAKRGERIVRRAATMRFGGIDFALTVGLLLGFGVVATILSTAVGFVQPHSLAARAFVVQGVVTALFGITGTMLYHPRLWWTSPLHLATQAAVPAVLVNLGLVFPVELSAARRHPAWRWLPWLVAAALTPWMIVEFHAEPPRTTALYLSYYCTAASILLLVGLAAHTYVRDRTPRVRSQLHMVWPGLVFGLSASLYGFYDIAHDGGTFPIQLIAPFPAIFYLSVAWAIARHDLFDIDRHLKSVIVFGLLTLLIGAGYAGVTATASWLGSSPVPGREGVVAVAFFVVVATLFEPMRWRTQALVERAFFRSRPDYRRTVRAVSDSLTTLLDRDDILASIGRTLSEAFQPETLHALLWLDEPPQAWTHQDEWMRNRPGAESYAALRAALDAAPDRMLDATAPQPSAVELELAPLSAALVVPLPLGGRTAGAFVVGARRSRQRYTTSDRQLLATLAAQTAIALANAQSYRALQQMNVELEDKVRSRTGELERSLAERDQLQLQVVHQEKMASLGVLVAGVAHEINNPVSFIVGTVPPLRAMLVELATTPDHGKMVLLKRAGEMVDVIADGAGRTADIVRDLRSFSRLGEAESRPMDVHEALDVVLRLIRPRWADRIVVLCDYGDLPLVEAAPEQLSQVFMNLLVNACDAIVGKGTIRLATRANRETVTITVRDDGAGIPPEVQSRVFDPFFSTKPAGQGTGLGLAISHGIVVRHGGSIELRSSPGSGTEFRVVLPVRQAGIGPVSS